MPLRITPQASDSRAPWQDADDPQAVFGFAHNRAYAAVIYALWAMDGDDPVLYVRRAELLGEHPSVNKLADAIDAAAKASADDDRTPMAAEWLTDAASEAVLKVMLDGDAFGYATDGIARVSVEGDGFLTQSAAAELVRGVADGNIVFANGDHRLADEVREANILTPTDNPLLKALAAIFLAEDD